MSANHSSLGSTRQPNRRRGGGIARMAVVAFVLLMLLTPLAAGRAFAEDDELIILDEAITRDDGLSDPVFEDPITPTPAPWDEVEQVDVENLDVLLPNDGPSSLYVNPVLCPDAFDLYAADYYGLAAGCNLGYANGYEVNVEDIAATPFWQQVVADGYVAIENLPANDYLVGLYHPQSGSVTMRMMCSGEDSVGNDVVPFFEAAVSGQIATVPVAGDLVYWCDVFIGNGGAQPAGTGEVSFIINKHVCPEGIVSDDIYFLASICHGQLSDIDFGFDNGSGGSWVATTDADGLASFGPVGTGPWTITESIPGGYDEPHVNCNYSDALLDDIGTTVFPSVAGGAFSLDVPAEAVNVYCDVYNFPTDSAGGSILVLKYTCPDGFDATTQDVYTECGALTDDVQFNVAGPSGYASQSDTGDSIGGAVSFGGLEAGNYEVVETVPAGYAAHVVSCSSDTKQFVTQHEQDLTGGASLPWLLDADEDIVCFWYNVPTHLDDSVDVFITKWGCPAGFTSHDAADLAAGCTDEMEGVDFTALHTDGATATDDTGGQPARAAFTPWYTGDSTISEDVPAGYGEPIVHCRVVDEVGDDILGYEYAEYAVSGGAIDLSIPTPPTDELYTVYCDWYNVPTHDDGSVTIHKWECPAATEVGMDRDYYLSGCTEPMEGVDFKQGRHSGSKSTVTTDASGEVTFSVDESSDWSIEEIIPAGYDENPMVFCRWGGTMTTDENGDPISPLAIDGFYNLGPNGGTTLRFDTYEQFGMDCNWFNIPTGDDHEDVTIYKYTCPAGYDLDAYDADPKSDCTKLTNGVIFRVLPDGGSVLESTTGDAINGAVTFGGVGDGAFEIWEEAPAGTIDTSVTCQWSEATGPYRYEELSPGILHGSTVGIHIDVELYEGDDLVCQWYNVPEKTWDGGELTITKYWCQGYTVSNDSCELGSGVEFLVGLEGGAPIVVETGPSGSVTLNLPEGAWQVTEKDYEWCKAIASDVDAEGKILVKPDHETTLTIYNCNADSTTTKNPPGTKNPPVTKFPNTGSGATATAALAAPADAALSTELLAIVGGLLQLGLVAAGRTLGLSPARVLAGVMRR